VNVKHYKAKCYRTVGLDHSLYERRIMVDSASAVVRFTPDGQIDYNKSIIHLRDGNADIGWEIIRQFIEDLGYDAKIETTREKSCIQVRGGMSAVGYGATKRGCTIGIVDGRIAIFYVKMVSQHAAQDDQNISSASMSVESAKLGLFAPDSLDKLSAVLKDILN